MNRWSLAAVVLLFPMATSNSLAQGIGDIKMWEEKDNRWVPIPEAHTTLASKGVPGGTYLVEFPDNPRGFAFAVAYSKHGGKARLSMSEVVKKKDGTISAGKQTDLMEAANAAQGAGGEAGAVVPSVLLEIRRGMRNSRRILTASGGDGYGRLLIWQAQYPHDFELKE